ncbi:MAG: FecR family protein [Candidatus Altiarchaeota archaeon]
MKKLSFLLLATGMLLVAQNFSVLAEESLWPQGDFDLVYPVYRMYTPSDPAPIDKDYKILFAFSPLSVRDGKVSTIVTRRTPLSYTLASQQFDGDGIIKMDGVYDKETGKISGQYEINLQTKSRVSNLNAGLRYSEGWVERSESGTFQGQVIKDHVVLNFACKKSSGQYYRKYRDNKEESGSISKCTYFFNKVAYQVIPIVKSEPATYKQEPAETPKKHVDSGVRVAGMTGQCDIEIDGVRRPLKMDDVIPVDAHIITEEDSKIILAFTDMSTFVVEPESHIVISAPAEKESKLKLVAGNIWANIKKMIKDGTMEVEMNQAVAGIKGTTFVCEEKDGKSTLKVFEGVVDFKSKASSETVQVKGGEKVVADNKGLSPVEKFDTFEEVQSLMKLRNEEDINWAEGEEKETQDLSATKKPEITKEKASNQWLFIGIILILALIIILVGLKIARKAKSK